MGDRLGIRDAVGIFIFTLTEVRRLEDKRALVVYERGRYSDDR